MPTCPHRCIRQAVLAGDAVAPPFLAHRIRGHGPHVGGEFIPFALEIAEEVALAAVETSLKIAPAACKGKPGRKTGLSSAETKSAKAALF